ncbi:MAG: hypothetical protein ACUVX8_14025 [Candidatus Zipacnadales bacterium]
MLDSAVFAPLVDLPAGGGPDRDKGRKTAANHRHLQASGDRSSVTVKKARSNPQVLGQAPSLSRSQLQTDGELEEMGMGPSKG